jgi:hypothetical protein
MWINGNRNRSYHSQHNGQQYKHATENFPFFNKKKQPKSNSNKAVNKQDDDHLKLSKIEIIAAKIELFERLTIIIMAGVGQSHFQQYTYQFRLCFWPGSYRGEYN